ncbi:MAG TPA: LytTR family DNA-binding domain-containing protein [Chitinophagaceae bacterium]|nr:LytTR family DNA-binding domain-containing protein [Chitinophagaceae bacterium]
MPECTVLIADDEMLAREAIKLQLQHIPDLQIFESANGKQAIDKIIEHKPDIVFLDIQMPLLNGLEVLKQLPEAYQPFIIIVTAFDMYALQAFDNDAIDYLLKPFTDQRFAKAFNKAFQMWQSKTSFTVSPDLNLPTRLKKLLAQLENTSLQSTITIKDGSKIFVVPLSDIMYIETDGDYLSVYTEEKKYLHKETLAKLGNSLPSNGFVRIHKSTIVNTSYIKELHSHFNGDYSVVLKNGKELRLSRNFREKLIHILG